MDKLGVDHDEALDFFYEPFREMGFTENGLAEHGLYVASVLANHAQVSTVAGSGYPTPMNLTQIFETFVVLRSGSQLEFFGSADPEILEIAGAQVLLLNGFFRDQMRRRHDPTYFDQLGQGFFRKVSELSSLEKRARFFQELSDKFSYWTFASCRVRRQMADDAMYRRYSLNL